MELFEHLIYRNQQIHVYWLCWPLFTHAFSNLSLKYKENNIYMLQLAELIQMFLFYNRFMFDFVVICLREIKNLQCKDTVLQHPSHQWDAFATV